MSGFSIPSLHTSTLRIDEPRSSTEAGPCQSLQRACPTNLTPLASLGPSGPAAPACLLSHMVDGGACGAPNYRAWKLHSQAPAVQPLRSESLRTSYTLKEKTDSSHSLLLAGIPEGFFEASSRAQMPMCGPPLSTAGPKGDNKRECRDRRRTATVFLLCNLTQKAPGPPG